MTNTSNLTDQNVLSNIVRIILQRIAQAIAIAVVGWFMTQLSLAGVNFQGAGLDSESIKAALVGGVSLLILCPIEIFKLIGIGIYQLRVFCHVAFGCVKYGFNKPIDSSSTEKDNTP